MSEPRKIFTALADALFGEPKGVRSGLKPPG